MDGTATTDAATGSDPHDLARFVRAQAPIFETALGELRVGAKRSHWMWFVFPQLRGLGSSTTAVRYGIANLDEARAYLAHPLLGERLRVCTQAVLATQGRSLAAIFGSPDDVKFRSSMTLFARAEDRVDVGAGSGQPFAAALDRFCEGRTDERTLALLVNG